MFEVKGDRLFHKEVNNFKFSVGSFIVGKMILSYDQAKFLNQNVFAHDNIILDLKDVECTDTTFKAKKIYLPESFKETSTLDKCNFEGKVIYVSREKMDGVIKKYTSNFDIPKFEVSDFKFPNFDQKIYTDKAQDNLEAVERPSFKFESKFTPGSATMYDLPKYQVDKSAEETTKESYLSCVEHFSHLGADIATEG